MPSSRRTCWSRIGFLILAEKFLLLEGELQNQEGVISVRVERVMAMREAYAFETVDVTDADVRSHDFH